MFASLLVSALAFSGPAAKAPRASRASVQMAAPTLETLPGKYALGGVFDPLGLGAKGDLIWLREAELKHGRLAMLAVVGYIAVDMGIHFPASQFEGLSSLTAHDAAVKVRAGAEFVPLPRGRVSAQPQRARLPTRRSARRPRMRSSCPVSLTLHSACALRAQSGAMQGLFGTVAILEVLDSIRVFPSMSKGWADHKIGSFMLDPLSMTNERTTLAEIKNGRLAMMAFSGARARETPLARVDLHVRADARTCSLARLPHSPCFGPPDGARCLAQVSSPSPRSRATASRTCKFGLEKKRLRALSRRACPGP